jgi:ribosomal-protein-alanine N-acetyltransferase
MENTGKPSIRKYEHSDRQDCLAIFASNCPDYLDPSEIGGMELWLDGQDRRETTYKNSEADFFYVLECDNKVVGCGGFYIVKNKPCANMAWGLVLRSHHKQGLGKQLFQYRLDQIEKNYPGYSVILDTSQHTFSFFEKLGFSVVKITPDAYGPGLDRYDMMK